MKKIIITYGLILASLVMFSCGQLSCNDSDNGMDYGNFGLVSCRIGVQVNLFNDSCNYNMLTENYCKKEIHKTSDYLCPGICLNGECAEKCYSENEECDPGSKKYCCSGFTCSWNICTRNNPGELSPWCEVLGSNKIDSGEKGYIIDISVHGSFEVDNSFCQAEDSKKRMPFIINPGSVDHGGYRCSMPVTWNDKIRTFISAGGREIECLPRVNAKTARFHNFFTRCYDGAEFREEGEKNCKSSDIWKSYAEEKCRRKCSKNGCGIEFFTLSEECNLNPRCTESDDGFDIYTMGQISFDGYSTFDTCYDNSFLSEEYCLGASGYREKVYCENGCANGACRKYNLSKCYEEDGGFDIYNKSTVMLNNTLKEDICINSTILHEYYCDENLENLYEKNAFCEYYCSNGRCLKNDTKRYLLHPGGDNFNPSPGDEYFTETFPKNGDNFFSRIAQFFRNIFHRK